MIDYHAPVDFTATVYTIEGETIRAHILANLVREHCREAPTPLGVLPVFHTRGAELWTWGPAGQHPRLVAEFETEKEAERALLLAHLEDADQAVHIYYRREDAETDLSDLLTDSFTFTN